MGVGVAAVALFALITMSGLDGEENSVVLPAENIEEQVNTSMNEPEVPITQPQRLNERYGVKRHEYQLAIPVETLFGQLPQVPPDFGETWFLFQQKKLDPEDISEEYYMQPEFYESWERGKKNHYLNPSPNYWIPYGYGVYPSHGVVEMTTEDTVNLATFFKAGWGVETFQGVLLDMDSDNFNTVISPNEFLLGPSYPAFNADPDWAKKISLKITPKEDTLPGQYTLRMRLAMPSEENREKWFEQYRSQYVNAAQSFVKVGEAPLVITVVLREAEAN